MLFSFRKDKTPIIADAIVNEAYTSQTDNKLLEVIEAEYNFRSKYKGNFCLDLDIMKTIKIKDGDYVKVTNLDKSVIARCYRLFESDDDKGIIRMTKQYREKLGVNSGQIVQVTKYK